MKIRISDKQDIIDEIRSQIEHNRITNIEELDKICNEKGLDSYDDILGGMEWNCCDRCGNLWDTMLLFWSDYDWDYGNEDLVKAIAQEKVDYCALCEDCVKELIKKGKQYG